MADNSKVGVCTTLSKEEQYKEAFTSFVKKGALVMGHPDVDGMFIHANVVIRALLELEGKLAQAEAEKEYRAQEWAQVLTNISGDVVKGEAEVKTLMEKLAGYEAAAPEVRALHAECQQVKARLHAFEQRYGARADMGVDIVYQYNATVGQYREMEKTVADLKAQVKQQAINMTAVMDEREEALRETIRLKEQVEGLQELSRLNTQSRRGRKKKV